MPIQCQSSANLEPNWIDVNPRSINCRARTTWAPILCQSVKLTVLIHYKSKTNLAIQHQPTNQLPILVQFANTLAIRRSLAILPIHYKSWTNLSIYCQSTNSKPIYRKYPYSKPIHPQPANSNSITKSNDNPPILYQNDNSIPILKQSANLCLIS